MSAFIDDRWFIRAFAYCYFVAVLFVHADLATLVRRQKYSIIPFKSIQFDLYCAFNEPTSPNGQKQLHRNVYILNRWRTDPWRCSAACWASGVSVEVGLNSISTLTCLKGYRRRIKVRGESPRPGNTHFGHVVSLSQGHRAAESDDVTLFFW